MKESQLQFFCLICTVHSYSFPSSPRLLEEWERSPQLSLSSCPLAECCNPILHQVIRSCMVCRYRSILCNVCMEGMRHFYFWSFFSFVGETSGVLFVVVHSSYFSWYINIHFSAVRVATKNREVISWSGFLHWNDFLDQFSKFKTLWCLPDLIHLWHNKLPQLQPKNQRKMLGQNSHGNALLV